MDFNLSEEHTSFADSVRRFAHSKLADGALQRAHASVYPVDVARQLAAQGLLGIAFSEEDGGQGGSLMHAVLAIQEVARSARKVQTSCRRATSGRSAPLWSTPALRKKSAGCQAC